MNPLEPLGALAIRGRADSFSRALDSAEPPPLARLLRETGQSLAGIAPGERFRADLRTRLLAVAAVQVAAVQAAAPAAAPVSASRAAVSWRASSRAGGVAAGAMASVVAVTGVAVAGSQSLPGDPFYGVKRTTEALQLRTADGDLGRGTRHLEFASNRLGEVRGLALGRDAVEASAGRSSVVLVSSSSPLADGAALGARVADRVSQTLADMDTDTLKGQVLLSAAARSSRDDAPLQALARFATRQSTDLERLLPSLPAASRQRALTSLAVVTEVAVETDALLGPAPCGPACNPGSAAPSAPLVTPPSADPLEPGLPQQAPSAAACGCAATPAPAPADDPDSPSTQDPPPGQPEPTAAASPEPSQEPGPSAAPSPSPSASPSGGPLPLPVPLPTLPVPLPTPAVPLPSLPPPSLPAPSVPTAGGTVLPLLSSLPTVTAPMVTAPTASTSLSFLARAPWTALLSGPFSPLPGRMAAPPSALGLLLPPSLTTDASQPDGRTRS